MNRKSGLLLTLMLALTISACGKKKEQVAVDTTTNPTNTSLDDGSANNAYGSGYSAEDLLSRFGIEGDPLNYKVLYFEYNSSTMDERSKIIASRHAQYLGENGGARVNLEGHADERGTRDYNLALGERRSQRVAEWMNAEGAASAIQTISYGEERPTDAGHTEAAWQLNRRVEIKY